MFSKLKFHHCSLLCLETPQWLFSLWRTDLQPSCSTQYLTWFHHHLHLQLHLTPSTLDFCSSFTSIFSLSKNAMLSPTAGPLLELFSLCLGYCLGFEEQAFRSNFTFWSNNSQPPQSRSRPSYYVLWQLNMQFLHTTYHCYILNKNWCHSPKNICLSPMRHGNSKHHGHLSHYCTPRVNHWACRIINVQ